MWESKMLSGQEWAQLLDAVSFGYGKKAPEGEMPGALPKPQLEAAIGLPAVNFEGGWLPEVTNPRIQSLSDLSDAELKRHIEASEKVIAESKSSFTESFANRFSALPKQIKTSFIAENCVVDGPLYRHVLGQIT